jgi:hypothetical protein
MRQSEELKHSKGERASAVRNRRRRRTFNPAMRILADVLSRNAGHADEVLYDDETDMHFVLFLNIRPEDWPELYETAGLLDLYDERDHPGRPVSIIFTEDTRGYRSIVFYTTIDGALNAWDEIKGALG